MPVDIAAPHRAEISGRIGGASEASNREGESERRVNAMIPSDNAATPAAEHAMDSRGESCMRSSEPPDWSALYALQCPPDMRSMMYPQFVADGGWLDENGVVRGGLASVYSEMKRNKTGFFKSLGTSELSSYDPQE
jgi:hypothetical protein